MSTKARTDIRKKQGNARTVSSSIHYSNSEALITLDESAIQSLIRAQPTRSPSSAQKKLIAKWRAAQRPVNECRPHDNLAYNKSCQVCHATKRECSMTTDEKYPCFKCFSLGVKCEFVLKKHKPRVGQKPANAKRQLAFVGTDVVVMASEVTPTYPTQTQYLQQQQEQIQQQLQHLKLHPSYQHAQTPPPQLPQLPQLAQPTANPFTSAPLTNLHSPTPRPHSVSTARVASQPSSPYAVRMIPPRCALTLSDGSDSSSGFSSPSTISPIPYRASQYVNGNSGTVRLQSPQQQYQVNLPTNYESLFPDSPHSIRSESDRSDHSSSSLSSYRSDSQNSGGVVGGSGNIIGYVCSPDGNMSSNFTSPSPSPVPFYHATPSASLVPPSSTPSAAPSVAPSASVSPSPFALDGTHRLPISSTKVTACRVSSEQIQQQYPGYFSTSASPLTTDFQRMFLTTPSPVNTPSTSPQYSMFHSSPARSFSALQLSHKVHQLASMSRSLSEGAVAVGDLGVGVSFAPRSPIEPKKTKRFSLSCQSTPKRPKNSTSTAFSAHHPTSSVQRSMNHTPATVSSTSLSSDREMSVPPLLPPMGGVPGVPVFHGLPPTQVPDRTFLCSRQLQPNFQSTPTTTSDDSAVNNSPLDGYLSLPNLSNATSLTQLPQLPPSPLPLESPLSSHINQSSGAACTATTGPVFAFGPSASSAFVPLAHSNAAPSSPVSPLSASSSLFIHPNRRVSLSYQSVHASGQQQDMVTFAAPSIGSLPKKYHDQPEHYESSQEDGGTDDMYSIMGSGLHGGTLICPSSLTLEDELVFSPETAPNSPVNVDTLCHNTGNLLRSSHFDFSFASSSFSTSSLRTLASDPRFCGSIPSSTSSSSSSSSPSSNRKRRECVNVVCETSSSRSTKAVKLVKTSLY